MNKVVARVLLATTRGWHLGQTAKALSFRKSLAGLWMSDKNRWNLPQAEYERCWAYHLAMKPFYHCAPQIWDERAGYAFIGLWSSWLSARLKSARCPSFNVAHAIMGFATELFDAAEARGALKVIDCPNSHPTTYYGYWQRECDLWCPGERVPIPRWMFARMNRELKRADLILCPSLFVRDSMVMNGIPESKCYINPFGVDVNVFRPRIAPPLRPRFVTVGTICLRKGHQYLFRAFKKVKAQMPDAELVCVGNYKQDFRMERNKWEGTFDHCTSLSHPQLAQLLQSCTAFVFPSNEEGFARVISEAMASGLPIVASHESGATTKVSNGVEGFIVRPDDTDQIADAMIKLARDVELNRKLGEASHKKGSINNDWQAYGDRLLALYHKCLNE